MAIEIFGREYTTAAEMMVRLGELTLNNQLFGDSDDRVTEINLLSDKIADLNGYDWQAAQLFARNTRVSVSWAGNQVLSARDEIEIAASNARSRGKRDWCNTK